MGSIETGERIAAFRKDGATTMKIFALCFWPSWIQSKYTARTPDYITSPEAQKLLGVNRQRISALLKTGQLRGKKDGRRWMIERASVEERLKALRK